ncbi:MAG: hypothetical protein EA397_01375 [Deltaproteobacteria bacterium]|nr:MAG: hypothetical protein EA397_01375 [Deltaproteobacteria bacterium]
MLDALIIGGGPHGTHLAIALLARHGLRRGHLAVLDPHDAPLGQWWHCAENTGMTHLRSPVVHHLGLGPWALREHARAHGFDDKAHFLAPYDRPSVELFRHHCAWLEDHHRLAQVRIQGLAQRIQLDEDCVRVETTSGQLCAREVVLALGASASLYRPPWAGELLRGGATIHHLFEPGFQASQVSATERVAVVGGGISAAQVALKLAVRGCVVHLVRRHGPRVHTFDSDPGWVGPKHMRGFLADPDPDLRRRKITAARHRGSMPEELAEALDHAARAGAIHLVEGEVTRAHLLNGLGSPPPIGLQVGQDFLAVDRVLLATGFLRDRPGGALVDRLVEEYELPCATCGYPILSPNLRWHARLLATGALAELQLGPVARNLVGARRAAERSATGW